MSAVKISQLTQHKIGSFNSTKFRSSIDCKIAAKPQKLKRKNLYVAFIHAGLTISYRKKSLNKSIFVCQDHAIYRL